MLLSVPAIVRSGLRGGLIPTQAGLLSFSRSTTRKELPASKVVVSGLACGSPLARPLGAPSESRSRQAEATPSKMRKSADLAAICWYGGETGSPFISYFLHTLTARAVVRHGSKNPIHYSRPWKPVSKILGKQFSGENMWACNTNSPS